MFATRLNCSNKFFGTKEYAVYFDVMTTLSRYCFSSFFGESLI